MLSFFRKHQRFFFIFTTVIIVISFVFFGAFGNSDGVKKVKEEPLCKAVDGSTITRQRLERMVQFISFSHLDLTDDRISSPNWLNDGVLEKEFLSKPLGELLAQEVFLDIREDLSNTVKKARSFRSYRHPGAPFLTAEAVWAQFAPESVRLSSSIAFSTDPVNSQTFDLLSRLYLQQKAFPSIFLKRVLAYQENQDERIQPDRGLSYADLSLLGLHSAKDWFGPTYIKAAAQVILNASAYAKKKGLDVSFSEARGYLLANLQEAAKKTSKEISAQDLYSVFVEQVRKMGLEERECVSLFQDIVLFKKLIDSSSKSLVVDPLLLQEFNSLARKRATVEVFSLPSYLQLRDFSSLLKLQVYIQAISPVRPFKDLLAFPKDTLPLAEIEGKTASLVQRDYVLEYGELDVKKEASSVGIKEMWNWQTSDLGWSLLKKEFPLLSKKEALTKDERFLLLDGLDSHLRLSLDVFSRESILCSDKNRIRDIFSRREIEKESCSISSQGEGLPFKDIKNKKYLVALLEKTALQGEASSFNEALEARDALSFYTEDGQTYYSIQVIHRSLDKRVLSFEEASSSGVLGKILNEQLEAAYPEIRKKNPKLYMKKNGSWEPLAQVKEKVEFSLFSDLLKAIQKEYQSFYGNEPSEEQKKSTLFYVENRMLYPLRKSLESLKDGEVFSSQGQWDLKREIKIEGRSSEELFPTEELFYLKDGSFSSLRMDTIGKGWFFQMINHQEADAPSAEDEKALLAPLQKEAEVQLISQLLNEMKAKGILPVEKVL